MSTHDYWARHWPLPTTEDLHRALLKGDVTAPEITLALLREGMLGDTPDAMTQGLHETGQRLYLKEKLQSLALGARSWHFTPPTTHAWPTGPIGDWPAWTPHLHIEALMAVWIALGADPWMPWRLQDGQPWGLPECALVEGQAGLLARILAHPACPPLDALEQRRVADSSHTKWQRHLPWLHAAVALDHPDLVRTLLQQGWNPNARDDQGQTALFEVRSSATTELLLAAGAQPDQAHRQGISIFQHLAQNRSQRTDELMRLMSTAGASPESPTPDLQDEQVVAVAFGYANCGNWDRLKPLLETHPEWRTWRQTVATPKGPQSFSLLGSMALHLFPTYAKAKNQPPELDWYWAASDSQPRINDALRYFQHQVTPEQWQHASLPGLTDGSLWQLYLHVRNPLQKAFSLSPQAKEHYTNDLDTLAEALEIRITGTPQPVRRLADRLATLKTLSTTWGSPNMWRDPLLEQLHVAFHPNPDPKDLWSRSIQAMKQDDLAQLNALGSSQAWEQFWASISDLLTTQWRTHVGEHVAGPLAALIHFEKPSLCDHLVPPAIRARLGTALLGVPPGAHHDRVRRIWEVWADKGAQLDTTSFSATHLARIHRHHGDIIAQERQAHLATLPSASPSTSRRRPRS